MIRYVPRRAPSRSSSGGRRRFRSRARGVGSRAAPYVIGGLILALAGTAGSLWQVFHPPAPASVPLGLSGVLIRLPGPGSVIGVALLVLAWTERNWLLAILALGYEVIVLVPLAGHGPSAYRPQLLADGAVLLLGGIGASGRRPCWPRPARSRPGRAGSPGCWAGCG